MGTYHVLHPHRLLCFSKADENYSNHRNQLSKWSCFPFVRHPAKACKGHYTMPPLMSMWKSECLLQRGF
ncbi:hypothetical protein HanHA300_Chr10g0355781 [Helianthus annuus]|uniref:Uncharacterized protein n=1 Tax=Helianthus annuus TaxID=4232 RepID=A0A251TK58_HELAN|nr:hypothetical protein HanHA300_Chr10g0355781 [Helianthus annuus]KAJ0529397.1 hypothetical protein HanHA89_Chr10g0377371 [Helianthus annuus]KAJ0696283.1 hypothetical protein HanLR1_Chr10g0355271 [Helianthus annuus]